MKKKAINEFKRNKTIALFYKHYSFGINQNQLAALAGVSERTVQRYWNLNEDGTISFRLKEKSAQNSPQEKSSQSRSWDTRRKDILIKKYQNAKTTGVKASIARKFKTTYGIEIKSLIDEVKPTATNNKKLKFEQKPIQLTAPYHIQILQEEVKLLRERIEKLESKK